MDTNDSKLIETPNSTVTTEAKKEVEQLAEKLDNPKLSESFNTLLARKSAQVF